MTEMSRGAGAAPQIGEQTDATVEDVTSGGPAERVADEHDELGEDAGTIDAEKDPLGGTGGDNAGGAG